MIGAEGFFAALMLALFHKQRTGEGQFVDFSLVRNLVHINDTLQYHNKKGHIQYRSGNHNSNMSPYGIYTGKTMSIVIGAVAPSTWNPLCDCMNRPDLKTDPDFATLPMRSKNHEKVEQIITDWLMTFDDTREAYEMMEKAGVAVAPVMTAEGRRRIQPPRLVGQLPHVPRVGRHRHHLQQALRIFCRLLHN